MLGADHCQNVSESLEGLSLSEGEFGFTASPPRLGARTERGWRGGPTRGLRTNEMSAQMSQRNLRFSGQGGYRAFEERPLSTGWDAARCALVDDAVEDDACEDDESRDSDVEFIGSVHRGPSSTSPSWTVGSSSRRAEHAWASSLPTFATGNPSRAGSSAPRSNRAPQRAEAGGCFRSPFMHATGRPRVSAGPHPVQEDDQPALARSSPHSSASSTQDPHGNGAYGGADNDKGSDQECDSEGGCSFVDLESGGDGDDGDLAGEEDYDVDDDDTDDDLIELGSMDTDGLLFGVDRPGPALRVERPTTRGTSMPSSGADVQSGKSSQTKPHPTATGRAYPQQGQEDGEEFREQEGVGSDFEEGSQEELRREWEAARGARHRTSTEPEGSLSGEQQSACRGIPGWDREGEARVASQAIASDASAMEQVACGAASSSLAGAESGGVRADLEQDSAGGMDGADADGRPRESGSGPHCGGLAGVASVEAAEALPDGSHTDMFGGAAGAASAAAAAAAELSREALKTTEAYRQAEDEEWRRRQEEIRRQAEEAQALRKRKREEQLAEQRKRESEARQQRRLEEVRTRQSEEANLVASKEQMRSGVAADLERRTLGCQDLGSALRQLGVDVEGYPQCTEEQVNAAFKRALRRFHPDRAMNSGVSDPRRHVEVEEAFKLIQRLKNTLPAVARPDPLSCYASGPPYGVPQYGWPSWR